VYIYIYRGYHKRLDFFESIKLKWPHICTLIFVQKDHNQLNENIISNVFLTFMMNNLYMIVVSTQDKIKLHYKSKISYDKAYVAKHKVIEHFLGSYKE
jgi:hypothetical protein